MRAERLLLLRPTAPLSEPRGLTPHVKALCAALTFLFVYCALNPYSPPDTELRFVTTPAR